MLFFLVMMLFSSDGKLTHLKWDLDLVNFSSENNIADFPAITLIWAHFFALLFYDLFTRIHNVCLWIFYGVFLCYVCSNYNFAESAYYNKRHVALFIRKHFFFF